MKKWTLALLIGALLIGCQAAQQDDTTGANENQAATEETVAQETPSAFGEPVDQAALMSLAEVTQMLENQEVVEGVVVGGKVTAVCQKKGCWMTLEKPDGEEMRVTFKDYALFMPFDLAGKNVVIRGKAEKKVTPVDELRHYAEDAGKSAEEIAAITEDEIKMTFEADGVVIRQ